MIPTPPDAHRYKLLSIHTPYVDAIREGSKRYELRSYNPGIMPGDWCIVYETKPTQHIATVFNTTGYWCLKPDEAWWRYSDQLGISRAAYDDYFNGKEYAYGVEIGTVRTFEPIRLFELRERHGFSPPQGVSHWRYKSIDKRILDAVKVS